MHTVLLTIKPHTSRRLAELAFLLILIAGLWMAAAEIPTFHWARHRRIVAALALAAAGLLLIIASHFGTFGGH
jgi:hypothetical protein